MTELPKLCRTCPAFDRESGAALGYCKAGPPVAIGLPTSYGSPAVGVWRLVRDNDWCMAHPDNASRMQAGPTPGPQGWTPPPAGAEPRRPPKR